MKFVLIAISVILIGHSAADVNICEGVANYIFLTDVTNCTNYFVCVNQEPIQQQCRDNLYFDALTQSCVANSSVCLQCKPDVLSVHAMDRTCNKYILCFAGTPVVQQCSDDLQYNPLIEKCDFANKVDCVSNQCSIVNNASDIVYVPSAKACNKYYICMNGYPWEHTCADNLNFNTACNCCSNVQCTVSTSNAHTSYYKALDIPPHMVNIQCPAYGTHFLPHARNNRYYVCVNGKGAELTCADGLFYDSKTETCRELQHILQN